MSKCKYTKEQLIEAVKNSLSIAQVCREVGIRPVGGNYKTLKEKFKEYNIDTSHFTGQGWNIGLKFKPNKPKELSEILIENSTYLSSNNLRGRLIKEGLKENKCECCGITEWQGKPVSLELHHINGNNTDNRLENLQLLCPNCHAKTDNFRFKNKVSKTSELRLQRYNEAQKLKEQGLIEIIPKIEEKPKIKPKKETKICPVCGKEFIPKDSTSKYCSVECYHEDTKGNRPSLLQLVRDFQELKSFIQVGNKYGVTDNAVRKWCKLYQIPFHTKELQEYINNFNNPDHILKECVKKERKQLNHQKIINDYKSGMSTSEIAKVNDCDPTSVRNVLYKAGIVLRSAYTEVIQYNENKEIQTFSSTGEAAKWVIDNNITDAKFESIRKAIRSCCKGDRKIAYNYIWKYKQ